MTSITQALSTFKQLIEEAIVTGGVDGKTSVIRSSGLINLIHEAVKQELVRQGVDSSLIFPPQNESKPEIKLAGFLKQKDQDVCVVPRGYPKETTHINWGPMAFQKKTDSYGFDYSTRILTINVRSQMSSISKNSDTLFERTFAEALNLHMRYPHIVLGEVYLIPVYEYDDAEVKNKRVAFKRNKTDVEKYISFFNSINMRKKEGELYKYERCTLLIVDFSKSQPVLYRDTESLKRDGIISEKFQVAYEPLAFDTFAQDILREYAARYELSLLTKE